MKILNEKSNSKLDLIEEDVKETKFEEVNLEVWKPEIEGDYIEGELIEKVMSTKDEESNRYFIKTKEGIRMIWGTTIIDNRLQFIDIGTIIKITFLEKKLLEKGRTLKMFKVEREIRR